MRQAQGIQSDKHLFEADSASPSRSRANHALVLLSSLAGLALILLAIILLNSEAWSVYLGEGNLHSVQWVLGLLGIIILGNLYRYIHTHLITPLSEVHHWASQINQGDHSARVSLPELAQDSELADDLNKIGQSIQKLADNLDGEVKKQTHHIAQKTHSLQVLYDVAASLNASRDLNDLLTRFLHTMRDIVNARAGTVRLLNEHEQMELVASIGLDEEVLEKERIVPVKRCLCGSAVDGGDVLFQEDLLPCQQHVGRPMLNEQGIQMIAVPLQYHGKNFGVYNLFIEREELEYREDVKALFTSIGRHLGMAIEKSRLDNESKRLSIMQERNALAHELHDSLAQTLASCRFQVSMLDETLEKEGQDATLEEIHQIKNGLDEAYTELRELLAHFRAPFDARGLMPAIEDLINQFRNQTGINTFFQKEWDSTGLPANMEMQVMRIIQEALANSRKHSQAQNVRVMLRSDADGNYRVLIEDDGIGFSKPAFSGHPGEHIGLSILDERARYLGGKLRIESDAGEGTRVQLNFRYPDPEQDKEPQHFALI